MIGNITPHMPEKLAAYLRPGAPGLLLTSGADGYATSAFTWIVAIDRQRASPSHSDDACRPKSFSRVSAARHRLCICSWLLVG